MRQLPQEHDLSCNEAIELVGGRLAGGGLRNLKACVLAAEQLADKPREAPYFRRSRDSYSFGPTDN